MSIKLQHFIELFRVESGTDSEGFPTERDEMLASIRAYREDRYGLPANCMLPSLPSARPLPTLSTNWG